MTEKIYRVRISTPLDQDIYGFLETVPTPRRGELLRHITRFYTSQLKEDGELFIFNETPIHPPAQFEEIALPKKSMSKEYKVRLDEMVDRHQVDIIERVPRGRRSEFWRHVIRYYISHLVSGELFIMPAEVAQSSVEEKVAVQPEPKPDEGVRPGSELDGFNLRF